MDQLPISPFHSTISATIFLATTTTYSTMIIKMKLLILKNLLITTIATPPITRTLPAVNFSVTAESKGT